MLKQNAGPHGDTARLTGVLQKDDMEDIGKST
jgi:hypothetical protein